MTDKPEVLPVSQMLTDLLCIIHRDGGHRQDEVGLEQAWMEAMMSVPFMLEAQDRISSQARPDGPSKEGE